MAKCIHCASRKGKRSCPALGGEICSACCGEHRRLTIACPDDCVWLGGGQLSVVPSPDVATSDRITAFHPKLQDFMHRQRRQLREAIDVYTSDGEVPVIEDAVPAMLAFAAYGHREADGKRSIDRFRESESRRLRGDELQVLSWLESARFCVLEVREVQLDEGFSAHDFLRGEDLFIRDKNGSRAVARFDVVAMWVIHVEDHLELEGANIRVPRPALDSVMEAARVALNAHGAPPHTSESRIPVIVHERVDEHFVEQARRPPVLHNTAGDLVVLSVARYDAPDQAAVKRALIAHPELRQDGDDLFGWIDESYNDKLDGPTLLGRIHLTGDGLLLDTNSRERHEDGRELLETTLGELIRHRADTFTDPQQAAQSARPAPAMPKLDTPELRDFLGTFLQSKVDAWIDESIPALGDKTPRDAASDPALRDQVIALVKDYDNLMQRNAPPGVKVDFASVWRELGLSPD